MLVREVRQKIEMDPTRPKIIVTEMGVGYRLPLRGAGQNRTHHGWDRCSARRCGGHVGARPQNEHLREALRGSVCHELRTPLSSILGVTAVLIQPPAVRANRQLSDLVKLHHVIDGKASPRAYHMDY